MQLGPIEISRSELLQVLLTLAAIGALFLLARSQRGRARAVLGCLTAALSTGALVYWVGELVNGLDRQVSILKALLALIAAACVFFEIHRAAERRPVAERWKRFVGVSLAVASITLYFNGFRIGYDKFWHRHDQYHYYFGAKYFRELGYDRLYRCTVVAEDQLGRVTETVDGRPLTLDMAADVRSKDKKIRNLGGDNLLIPASVALDHPEECTSHFSPERWEQFKRDIKFFRFATYYEKDYWDGMQRDHGYNPPPVWTLTGYLISSLHDASEGFMQVLAAIDEVYLLAMFAGIYWAFGWRVFSVAAVVWGCQALAPNFWTIGAFLRQDWLFYFVMAACFARKRCFRLAGATIVYAGLLRVFPGLVVIGWLVVAGAYVVKHKRMRREHVQALVGGVAAAVVLVGASLVLVGKDSYQQFYKHTIEVHDQTPLTNHMGLRVLVGHRTECLVQAMPGCEGRLSGRMKFTENGALSDPFERWKEMRLERWAKYKPIGYAIVALTFALFVAVVRRIRSLWLAQAVSAIWIVLLSQLTNYYYAFILIVAPVTRVRRDIEVWIFGFVTLTQLIELNFRYYDDRFTVLTWLTLFFCYFILLSVAPKRWFSWSRVASPSRAEPAGREAATHQ